MAKPRIDTQHHGKTYTAKKLSALTGKSIRTLQIWRKAGYLKKVTNRPVSYYVIPSKEFDEDTLVPINLDDIDPEMLNNDIPDVTEEVEELGGVEQFLALVEHAKSNAHIVRTPIKSNHKKILALSDLHCPFQNDEMIKEAIEEHSDADVIVLNGDIIDAYGASSYSQDKLVTILKEYNTALELVRKLSKKFPQVVLVRGNHDQRVDRYFSKKFDPHMFALAQRDILSRLARGEIYNEAGEIIGRYKFNNVIYNPQGGLPWIAVIGKTVFMHPHSYSGKQMQTVVNARTHLENYIDTSKYDSIVIGHTHKVGKIVEHGKLLIEQGCVTQVMDYQKEGILSRRPTVLGYAVIYQDEEGNTDFNRSTFVYKGTLNHMK